VDAIFILKGGTLFLVEFTVRFGRPTLENQCAMIEGDIIKQFHDAAVFRSNRMDYEDDYGVAITLYHYGYPLLQRFDPDQLNVLVEAPRFDLPAGEGIRSVPFFSLFIGGKWQGIVEDGRYAVVMGMGANMNIAHTNAVKALKNVRIPQVTWRRDIGTTHHDVMSDLRKRGLV
jgi:phosphoribosylamine-glycine ligase